MGVGIWERDNDTDPVDGKISRPRTRNLTPIVRQDEICDLFKEKFGYVEDEDFADHTPADQEDVDRFIHGGGSGPDIDDLHLDCRRGKGSGWNKMAMELMVDELMEKVKQDPDRRWPTLSHDVVEELVWNRFKRLMTVWRDARPKTGVDGAMEDLNELERRLNDSRDDKLKVYRHFTRRNSVRVSVYD